MSNNEISTGEQDLKMSNDFNPRSKQSTKPNITSCKETQLPTLDCLDQIVRRRPLSLRIILRRCSAESLIRTSTKGSEYIEDHPPQMPGVQSKNFPQLRTCKPLLSIRSVSKQSLSTQICHDKLQSSHKTSSTLSDLSCGGWDTTSQLTKAAISILNCRSGMYAKRMSFYKPTMPSGGRYLKASIDKSLLFDSSMSGQTVSPSKLTFNLPNACQKPTVANHIRISCLIALRSPIVGPSVEASAKHGLGQIAGFTTQIQSSILQTSVVHS